MEGNQTVIIKDLLVDKTEEINKRK